MLLRRQAGSVQTRPEVAHDQDEQRIGEQHHERELQVDPGHDPDGAEVEDRRLQDVQYTHAEEHPHVVHVVHGSRHEIARALPREVRLRQSLQVCEQVVPQPVLDLATDAEQQESRPEAQDGKHGTDRNQHQDSASNRLHRQPVLDATEHIAHGYGHQLKGDGVANGQYCADDVVPAHLPHVCEDALSRGQASSGREDARLTQKPTRAEGAQRSGLREYQPATRFLSSPSPQASSATWLRSVWRSMPFRS